MLGLSVKAIIRIFSEQTATALQSNQIINLDVVNRAKSALTGAAVNGIKSALGMTHQDIIVQYNPSTLSISEQITEATTGAGDGLLMGTNILSNSTRTLNVDLIFCKQEGLANNYVKKRVETFIAMMMQSPDRRISFSWTGLVCTGCVTSVSATYDMFDWQGYPLYGTVKLTIQEEKGKNSKSFDKMNSEI